MSASLLDILGTRPALARTLAAHLRAFDEGVLPARTRELVALMVSWLNACERCVEVHGAMAERLGIDRATLDDLVDYGRSPRFAEPERAALAAAVALTREPRGLPPNLRDALDRHFEAAQVVELIALIGVYNYVNRANNALNAP